MAHQAQSITPTPNIQLFNRPPTIQAEETYLPRGRVIFSQDDTITAKNAGDTNQIQYLLNLPVNFGYVPEFFSLGLFFPTDADAANYEQWGQLAFQWTNPAVDTDTNVFLRSEGTIGAPTNRGRIFTPVTHLCEPFKAEFPNTRLIAICQDTDSVNATAAGTANLYATFLQYDIRQLDDVRVNAPVPVRVC